MYIMILVIGGGRNYVSLPSAGTPKGNNDGKVGLQEKSNSTAESTDHSNRPQLKVVIPGQKGFIPKTVYINMHINR